MLGVTLTLYGWVWSGLLQRMDGRGAMGLGRRLSSAVLFTLPLSGWDWSGLLPRMEGRGEPGTGLLSSLGWGMMGVIVAWAAGAPLL